MSDLLQATYADLKTVKTRSVCQVVLEMPIEALTDVVRLLGAPVPGNEVWVAVARLRPGTVQQEAPAQIEHANDEDDPQKPPRPLSQIAGMLCGIGAFQQFICEESDGWDHRPTSEEAAEWLRSNCGIKSRAELNTNEVAAQRFRKIRAQYDAWMRVPA